MRPPRNFSWIESYLAASAMPRDSLEIKWLRSSGITTIVSLEPMDDHLEEEARSLGIRVVRMSVPEFSPPSMDDMLRFISMVEEERRRGGRVLVHCYAGCGRTGTIVAAYLVHRGISAGEAIERIRALRPCSIESISQESSIYWFERVISSERSRNRQGPS